MLNMEETKKYCSTSTPRAVAFHPRWTETAIDCHLRNSNCEGCFYASILEDNCKMHAQVKLLLNEFGPPMIIDTFQRNDIERNEEMKVENRGSGFVVSYDAETQKTQVFKNKRGLTISGVIIDNIQRVKERWPKDCIIDMYNRLNLDPENALNKTEVLNKYDKNQIAQLFWDLCVELTTTSKKKDKNQQRVKKQTPGTPGRPPRTVEKEYQLLIKDTSIIESIKLPKQAKLCATMLIDNFADKDIILEDEIRVLVEKYKTDGILVTKQDSWRIFSYYQDALKRNGVIKYE